MIFWSKLIFASCVRYFDRACDGVCMPSRRIQVGDSPAAKARVNGINAFSLVLRTEACIARVERDKTRQPWNSVSENKKLWRELIC